MLSKIQNSINKKMKITTEIGQKIFFTSDTHYHHKNIVDGISDWDRSKGNTRPFKTQLEMDSTIVKNINKTVGENDILVHLGDWSFGGIEQIFNLREEINCKNIYLLFGNHDHHIKRNKILPNCHFKPNSKKGEVVFGPNPNNYGDDRDHLFAVQAQDLFIEVSEIEDLTIRLKIERKNKTAQAMYKKYRFVICHYPLASWNKMKDGVMHLHGHIHSNNESKLGPGKMLDVGMDGHPEFRPYELNEILDLIKDRPTRGLLRQDHHQ